MNYFSVIVLRPAAYLVVAAQLGLALQPLSALAQDSGQAPYKPQSPAQNTGPADKTSEQLAQAQELVAALWQHARARQPQPASQDAGAGAGATDTRALGPGMRIEVQRTAKALQLGAERHADTTRRLKNLLASIEAGTASVRADFDATRAQLLRKKLPAEILARHDEAVTQFEQRSRRFNELSAAWRSSPDDNAVQALAQFFDQYPAARRHTAIDAGKLPWGTPKGITRMPAETKTAWFRNLYADQKVQLAQAGGMTTLGGVQFSVLPEPGAAPQDADIAETTDITLTPAIRAKAQELGGNPSQITNWVTNNIQWLPTWGSIQGAEGTLDTLKGNAIDIASLHIALLRAAGVPSRYRFGTIELGAEEAMNWVGGVKKPEAALNLFSQGGIAARGIVEGGRIARIRLEHVWVEAYVHWAPSRGNRHGGAHLNPPQHPHPNAHRNAWVPVDASFKQYVFSEGMNLEASVPFNASEVIDAIQQDATVMPNRVQSLNEQALQAQLRAYHGRLQAYIDSTPAGASSTLADILGSQVISTRTFSLLPGSLPYRTVSESSSTAEIPASLRWKITFKLYASLNDKAAASPLVSHGLPLPGMGTRRISASAVPASEADHQLLASYVSGNAASLPVYLIRQKVQLKLDNALLVETGPQAMGASQWWSYVLQGPNSNEVEEDFAREAAVGDAIVFGVDGHGTSFREIASRAQNVDPNSALENLHHFAIGYWARAQESDQIVARQLNAVTHRLPSVGLFSSPLTVKYSWGIARAGQYSSYAIDVRRLSVSAVDKTSIEAPVRYLKAIGAKNSFLEGRVIEEILDLSPGAGVSAASVATAANQNGIALWQLNAANLNDYLEVMTLSSGLRQSIVTAVQNGWEVLAPEDPVDIGLWYGGAYIATDPASGSGAYVIDGGANGGEVVSCETSLEPLVESIAQKILTQVAIRIALFLVAEAGLAVGVALVPPAAPALAQAMVMVGIVLLTFPADAEAAGSKCGKSSKDCHRGRFQAQGDDIRATSSTGKKSDTKSVAWTLPFPPTAAEGIGYLESLKTLLNPSELRERLAYFKEMEDYVLERSKYGGICVPYPGKNAGPNPNITSHVKQGIRVDLEVKAGSAFVK